MSLGSPGQSSHQPCACFLLEVVTGQSSCAGLWTSLLPSLWFSFLLCVDEHGAKGAHVCTNILFQITGTILYLLSLISDVVPVTMTP